jgi:adenine-specific DNA-methyltransferase
VDALVGVEAELSARKARGAFFTPRPIAEFLARWAVRSPDATVLDPTCGEAVFLLAAGNQLRRLQASADDIRRQLYGIDIHGASLVEADVLLEMEGLSASLVESDFFEVRTPDQLSAVLPFVDAVVGNPPFVRYQEHTGSARSLSVSAALRQGVRLSGLASSWAASLVHASGFLKQDGRLAMVLPAELLTVNYAEPIRRWLRERFSGVTLVVFDRLQFDDALERVVLLLAHGTGGCDSFNLVYLNDADELDSMLVGDSVSVLPAAEGKWTDLLLPAGRRRLFRAVIEDHFVPLGDYGSLELGTVTGANDFFTLTESERRAAGLEKPEVRPVCPPGTKHLRGASFSKTDWRKLLEQGEKVWLFCPESDDLTEAAAAYVRSGLRQGIASRYKCKVRSPWWRPPVTTTPDLFFTYMSHRYPRLINNTAAASFVNSMHGLRLQSAAPKCSQTALPYLMLNSATMLGAELNGRSYGGGILKMEPREAAVLPLPSFEALDQAWQLLRPERNQLARQLADGLWTNVVKRIDSVLLGDVMGITVDAIASLHQGAAFMRERRLRS